VSELVGECHFDGIRVRHAVSEARLDDALNRLLDAPGIGAGTQSLLHSGQ
jgi:hypothetical protein